MKATAEIIDWVNKRLEAIDYCRGGIGEEDVHYDERDLQQKEDELKILLQFINEEDSHDR